MGWPKSVEDINDAINERIHDYKESACSSKLKQGRQTDWMWSVIRWQLKLTRGSRVACGAR